MLAESTHNLLENGGFETVSAAAAAPWIPYGNTWNGIVRVDAAAAKTGSYGIAIETDTAGNPYVVQPVPVEEGATYTISSFYKALGVIGTPGYKIEFYSSYAPTPQAALTGFTHGAPTAGLDGQWHELEYEIKAPSHAKYMYVYLRLYGTGTVYFDDASVIKSEHAPQIILAPNQIYYYPDAETGSVSVSLRPTDKVLAGKKADVRLVRESDSAVVFEQTDMTAASELSVSFQPNVLAIGQPYRLSAELKDAADQTIELAEKTIYRWNRPTTVPDNGPILVNSQPFFPVIAYHAELDDLPYMQQIGVNTIQGVNTSSEETVQTLLDTAQANGLKVLQPLYYNLKVKENFALTEQMVARFKTHPALLGWMIMDEPAANGIPQWELLEAYKRIRAIDPDHPTYMVESEAYAYRSTGQATDILVTDVYPYSTSYPRSLASVGNGVRKTIQDTDGVKPVWTILQTFRYPEPTTWNYLPTIGQVRNMAYQALLAGSRGLGYYSINDPGWKLSESELWPGLTAFKDELPLIAGLATYGSKTAEQIDSPVQWGVWSKDGDQYAIAINVTKTAQSAEIPMADTGNRIRLLFGDEPGEWESWDEELTVELGPEQALVYQITPFQSDVQKAIQAMLDGEVLLSHTHWQQEAGDLSTSLESIQQALTAVAPDMDTVAGMASQALNDTVLLKSWVEGQNDTVLEGKRGLLLALLDEVYERLLAIARSTMRVEIQPFAAAKVSGETATVHVNIRNSGAAAVEPWLRIDWPDVFGIAPTEREVGSVASEDTASDSETIVIPHSVLPGSYTVSTSVYFHHNGTPLHFTADRTLRIVPLLEAKLTPESIDTKKSGAYPFAIELVNGSAEPITVELARTVTSGLTAELAETVTLSGRETRTVQGNAIVPSVTRGVYTLSVVPKVNDAVYGYLPLTIRIDTNKVYNGGFETAKATDPVIPDGWHMRVGVWDRTTARSGSASAKLNPDAGNSWNVINTSVGREMPVTSGRQYTLSGWVKNGSTAGSVELGIRQIDRCRQPLLRSRRRGKSLSTSRWTSRPTDRPGSMTLRFASCRSTKQESESKATIPARSPVKK
ncbi:MAG: hypothetical protein K0Q94_4423 [Paenibacillus sp.]|nr:hypothetical protein [Paenibacillus sp.]